jgi:hypothetical protein
MQIRAVGSPQSAKIPGMSEPVETSHPGAGG